MKFQFTPRDKASKNSGTKCKFIFGSATNVIFRTFDFVSPFALTELLARLSVCRESDFAAAAPAAAGEFAIEMLSDLLPAFR